MKNTSTQHHHPRYMKATNSSTNKKQEKYKNTSSPFKTLLHSNLIIPEQPYNIKQIKHNNNKAHINVTFAQKFVNKPNIKKHKNKDNFEGGIGTFMNTNEKKKTRHYSYDYNNSICTARVLNPSLNEEGLNCKVKYYKGRINRNVSGGGGLKCLFDRTPSKFFNKGKKRCFTQERKGNEIFSEKFLYDNSIGIGKGKKRRSNEESVGLNLNSSLNNEDWGWGKGKKRIVPLTDRDSNDNIFFN